MSAFIARLGFAIQGCLHFFRTETNGKIQACVAIVVVAAGFIFNISAYEWLWVLLCIALVIGFEMLNTAIETLSSHLHPQQHQNIKIVKDIAAGAVLWAAFVSVIIGAIIFLPRMLALFTP